MANHRRILMLVGIVVILIVGIFLGVRMLNGQGNTVSGSFSVAYPGYNTVPLVVGLNDATGYFKGDPITLPQKDKQVLGTYQGNSSSGTYVLTLPQQPEGNPFDLTGGNNPGTAVHIYEVRLMSDVASRHYMAPNEDPIASSLKISVDLRVQGGKMLVWAADDKQTFPTGYGPDKTLFTADDPRGPIPAGWSLVDLDSTPFKVSSIGSGDLNLITTGIGDVVDYSTLSCDKLIPTFLDRVQQNYPFTQLHHIDWTALRAKLIPESQAAKTDADCERIIREFGNAIPDGHVDFHLPLLISEWQAANVGLRLASTSDKQVVVTAIAQGGPADQAGIKLGAAITGWDGKPIEQAIQDEVLQYADSGTDWGLRDLKLRLLPFGAANTSVAVTFQNPGSTTPEQSTLQRLPNLAINGIDMETPAVHDNKLDSGVGYLVIHNFVDESNLTGFDQALDGLIASKTPGLIIDVRNNPGGLSQESDAMASRFFDNGFVVGRTFASDGRLLYEDRVDPRPTIYEGCVAVLVNLNTASSGDIFAYTMKSSGRAIIVGNTPSAGMAGSVSGGEYDLPDGASIQVPTSNFVDANNQVIVEGQGVAPDVSVPVTVDSLLSPKDEVLDAAVKAVSTCVNNGGYKQPATPSGTAVTSVPMVATSPAVATMATTP